MFLETGVRKQAQWLLLTNMLPEEDGGYSISQCCTMRRGTRGTGAAAAAVVPWCSGHNVGDIPQWWGVCIARTQGCHSRESRGGMRRGKRAISNSKTGGPLGYWLRGKQFCSLLFSVRDDGLPWGRWVRNTIARSENASRSEETRCMWGSILGRGKLDTKR